MYWHGAAWTFVVWGLSHGILSVLEKIFNKYLKKIPSFLRIICTFIFVNTTWVFFRANTWDSAFRILKGMYLPQSIDLQGIPILAMDGIINFPSVVDIMYISAIIFILSIIVFKCKNTIQKAEKFTYSTYNLFFITIIFCISVIHLSRASIFIYFNF